jgi:hypothetical protein
MAAEFSAADGRLSPEVDIFRVWSHNATVKTVAAAKLQEQCLSLLDRLGLEGLVITKHGKPVARGFLCAFSPAVLGAGSVSSESGLAF